MTHSFKITVRRATSTFVPSWIFFGNLAWALSGISVHGLVCFFLFSLSIILVSFFSFNLNSLSVMVISLLTWWWTLPWQWNTQTRRVRLGTPSTRLMFWRPMAAARRRAFLSTVTLWTAWWAHRVRTGCASEILVSAQSSLSFCTALLTGCLRSLQVTWVFSSRAIKQEYKILHQCFLD